MVVSVAVIRKSVGRRHRKMVRKTQNALQWSFCFTVDNYSHTNGV